MEGLKFWLIVLNVICLLTFVVVLRLSSSTGGRGISGTEGERAVSSLVAQHFSLTQQEDGGEKAFLTAPEVKLTQKVTTTAHLHLRSTPDGRSTNPEITAPTNPPLLLGGVKEEFYNISGTSPANPSRLHKVHWTSLYGKREDDSYHFFSAYYDTRRGSHRPAVIVMGYVYKQVKDVKFYCVFKTGNGSTHCLKSAAHRQHPTSCFAPELKAKIFHFFCDTTGIKDEPPVTVRMSTSNTCDPKSFSGEIPIRNRKVNLDRTPPKKYGICVGGPLVQEETKTLLRDVVEFVEMSKLMGVEMIVFYANDTQVDIKILQHLWTRYPDLVRTIGWKKFSRWNPMHYYGQLLIISDCFHRFMYEVDYIAMIDVDEMIFPLKHDNWNDMMSGLIKRDPKVTAFKFQNAFLAEAGGTPPKFCPNMTTPKYFTRTKHYRCFVGHGYRPKIMSKARYVFEPNIHYTCTMVAGHDRRYNVPGSIAQLGHYRAPIPNDCAKKPTYSDKSAMKFLDRLKKQMCPAAS